MLTVNELHKNSKAKIRLTTQSNVELSMNVKQKIVQLKKDLPLIIFMSWLLGGGFYTMAGVIIGSNGIVNYWDLYGNHITGYTSEYSLGVNIILQGFTILGLELASVLLYSLRRYYVKQRMPI
jgi:hypothetical protein